MTNTEEALALLTAPCTDERFFQRALKSLCLVTQCRWAAFSKPVKKENQVEVISFCDNKQQLPNFQYPLIGSPCNTLYQLTPPNTHVIYPDSLQKKFPECQLIKDIGAQSYQAELIFDENNQPLGHIFVMDSLPQTQQAKNNEIFRVLAHRIGIEYRRLSLIDDLSLHKAIIKNSPLPISFQGRTNQYEIVSQGFKEMLNQSIETLNDIETNDSYTEEIYTDKIKSQLDRAFQGETIQTGISIFHDKLKKPRFFNLKHTPYFNQHQEVTGVITSADDISDIKDAKEQIAFINTNDPLTLLPNRKGLFRYFQERSLEYSGESCLAILYLDLTNFRATNERLGHELADKVLIITGKRISSNINKDDFLARINGDEFVLLVQLNAQLGSEVHKKQLKTLSERLLSVMSGTIRIEHKTINLNANVGIHISNNPTQNLSGLICQAEKALYQAKQTEENNITFSQ